MDIYQVLDFKVDPCASKEVFEVTTYPLDLPHELDYPGLVHVEGSKLRYSDLPFKHAELKCLKVES